MKRKGLAKLVFTILAVAMMTGCSQDNTPVTQSTKPDLETNVATTEIALPKKYAVIINGDTSENHYYNTTEAQNTLMIMGFLEEDIFPAVIYPNHGAGEGEPTYFSTAHGKYLEDLFNHLSQTVTDQDMLLVYVTGHGDNVEGKSIIALDDTDLGVEQYVEYLSSIQADFIVNIMDICLAEDFCVALAESLDNVYSVANSTSDKINYCTYFSQTFWQVLADPSFDIDHNGWVSLNEAFAVAMAVQNEFVKPELQSEGVYLPPEGYWDVSFGTYDSTTDTRENP